MQMRELEARPAQLQCPENWIQSIGCCPSTRGVIGSPLPVHPPTHLLCRVGKVQGRPLWPRRAATCWRSG